MDPNAVILDISSDEEVDPNNACDPVVGVDKGFIGDLDWLKEFLDDSDVIEERKDDSDDVVLVGELLNNPKQNLKPSVGGPADDDDCVVLEGDPDKLVSIQNDTTSDSDDVLVVGQKGQVACRDFPHSRHLCANFPFTSTPHERHYNQCHCYVCDSLAPCFEWGTGISNIDHCHATEKDEFWTIKRKSLKNINKSPPPVSGVHSISLAVGVTQMNPNYSVPPVSLPNSVAQSQVCRPTPIHPGTTSTNFSTLTVNQGRTQQSRYVVPRHKLQPHLISQQLLSTSNRTIPRARRNNVSNLGAQFNLPCAVFKRTGSVELGSTTTRCAYSANNYGSQYHGHAPSGVTPNNRNSIRDEDLYSLVATPSTTHWGSFQPMNGGIATTVVPSEQNMRSMPANSMCSRPQLSSQPQLTLQTNVGNLENWMPSLPQESLQSYVVLPLPQESVQSYVVPPPVPSPYQESSQPYVVAPPVPSTHQESSQPYVVPPPVPSPHQESSQPYVGSMFVNSPSSQPHESSQPYVGSMFVTSPSSQPRESSQPYIVSMSVNSPSQPLASSCSNAGNIPAGSAPCQPYSQSSDRLSNCNQSIIQLGNQTSSWAITTARQSNQHPPVEKSQLQSAEPTGENPFLRDFDTQYNVDIGSSSLHFEIEKWLWDNQLVTGGAETSLHSGLMLSPEPALPIDAGILYDF